MPLPTGFCRILLIVRSAMRVFFLSFCQKILSIDEIPGSYLGLPQVPLAFLNDWLVSLLLMKDKSLSGRHFLKRAKGEKTGIYP